MQLYRESYSRYRTVTFFSNYLLFLVTVENLIYDFLRPSDNFKIISSQNRYLGVSKLFIF
jgi:hypothetical protein